MKKDDTVILKGKDNIHSLQIVARGVENSEYTVRIRTNGDVDIPAKHLREIIDLFIVCK